MKKALIVYAVLFLLTLAVPAIVCFGKFHSDTSGELVNIFRQCISLIAYYH